jgi:hypothetical protein
MIPPTLAGKAEALAAGAGKATTGTNPTAASPLVDLPALPSSRRQRNTRLDAIPCWRATEDTEADDVSATTAAFSARVHLRRVSATMAKLFSWIGPDIGTAQISAGDHRHQDPVSSHHNQSEQGGENRTLTNDEAFGVIAAFDDFEA